MMLIARYAQQPCPYCGHTLNATMETENDDVPPVVGDLSMCVQCHGFLRWEERQDSGELWQVRLSPREFTQLPAASRSDLLRARAKLERIKAEQKALEKKAH